VGGALAALTIPWIAIALGWRWAFAVSGSLGLVWVVLWLWVYHPLDKHPRVTKEEIALIEAGQDAATHSQERGARRYLALAKNRNVWGIVLGRALTDPIWWFYVFWLPQYLSDARGFSLKQIAMFAWIPFVAADAGNFTGGWISGICIRRGMSVVKARTWVCFFSCLPILAGIPAARVHSVFLALGLICVALWGFASWSTMGLTLPSDLFPHDVVATVTGLSGLAAGLVSSVFTLMMGLLVDRFSYGPAFWIAGLLPVAATASVFLLIREPAQA
jgi:ACS family hexuronate transporter-like MFS transporter